MNLLFIDEFKHSKKTHEFYGLCAVLINTSSYIRFKNGFYNKLKKLGWNEKIEIKGRYSFSVKGDKDISIEERLKFVESLFELSKSGSGKYASAKVFYAFDFFNEGTKESDMYKLLMSMILKKLPKGSKQGNKNGKNNIIIFLDNNDCLDMDNMSNSSQDILRKRNLFLVERCISITSGNSTPGMIFADHVAYFIDKYIKTSTFNKVKSERVKELLEKFSGNTISSFEQEELKACVISHEKEKKSLDLLKALKTMVYVKNA